MVEITSLSKDLPPLNVLVYADSGAGKTVFAGSANRVLFVAPEDSGLLSASMTGSKADKIKIKSWSDMEAAYDYVYDNQYDLAEKYDWIVIDSLTSMQGMLLRDIVANERIKRVAKDQDPEVPQIQDYQKLYILMERMVLAFNDVCINTLYTSLMRNAEDPDGEEFVLPMLGSNKPTDYRIAMLIASHMTSYGQLKVEVVNKPIDPAKPNGDSKRVKQRAIYFEDTGSIRGKDRTTRLTPKVVLPPRMALQRVTDIARGLVDHSGNTIQGRAPAKKTSARKTSVKKVAPGTDSMDAAQKTAEAKYDAAQDPSDMNGASNESENNESTELTTIEA